MRVLHVDDRLEATLHLKLPAGTHLGDASVVAAEVEQAILRDVPAVSRVATHVEPLDAEGAGREASDDAATAAMVRAIVDEQCGRRPHEVRLVATADGLVAFVTLSLGREVTLADAHHQGGAVRRRIRDEVPGVADAFVEARP